MVFAVLLVLMVATRFSHAGSGAVLPDATWAVFFLGGFYLTRDWRWSLATLFAAAVAVDYLAIRYYGISDYCLTIAYWAIVPAYSLLWLGGAWLRSHFRRVPSDLVRLAASFVVSATLCCLVSHSAFYWLGDRVARPSLAQWWSVFTEWYAYFLAVPGLYVALAALVHVALTHRPRTVTSAQTP
jgi:hypothetical protein